MKKVLIVEDDENILSNVSYLLNANGYETITAKDGLEGFNLAKKNIPDMIISDIMMPEIDGYELKKKLNASKKTSSIPFIFLTAKADMQDLRAGMNIGADDYIVKPFKSRELLETIEVRFRKLSELEKRFEPAEGHEKFKYDDRIFIDIRDKQMFIKINEIKFILSEGAYTRVTTADNKKIIVRKLLKDWERVLPKENFLRIHRGAVINLEYVVKLEKWFNRTYKIYIKEIPDALDISQRFAVKLKSKLSF
jgi:DNA-binding LytR/AlgR family response regulator